ncbi:hypothetical protein MMC10_001437 [Thelotrema lepadinum]|nr:hypothetical protein [Thelotrema lepadinum]
MDNNNNNNNNNNKDTDRTASLSPYQQDGFAKSERCPSAESVPSSVASSLSIKAAEHFKAPVRRRFAELPILACSFLSGMVDSTMFAAFKTFALMQTGNTIFLALGASGLDSRRPYGWLHSLLSLICFALGAVFFSRLNTLLSPAHKRSTLAISFSIQSVFIFAAAILVQVGWVDGSVPPANIHKEEWNQLLAIALLSFQASGQMIATFTLNYGELSTVVVTGLLCDLWRDPAIFAPFSKNPKRNRRAAGFVLMLLGGIAGGWLCKAVHNITATLWVAGGAKTAITVAWCFWPAEVEQEDSSPV